MTPKQREAVAEMRRALETAKSALIINHETVNATAERFAAYAKACTAIKRASTIFGPLAPSFQQQIDEAGKEAEMEGRGM